MNENADMSHGMGSGIGGRMWHWACCILPIVALLMWITAVVFVVLSWISVMNTTGEIWGLGPQWYIWNAVMFGILAIYGRSKSIGRHDGNTCC